MRTEFGARGEDDRHARAEHDAGSVGMGEEGQVLRQHVAGFEVGHHQDLRPARDRRAMPLMRAASGSMALSKASGPSSRPPVIWPRSAILHSAAASMVEGILRGHGLDRRKDRHARLAEADADPEVDRVLHDVALGIEVGEDVDRGIGDEQRLGVAGTSMTKTWLMRRVGAEAGRGGGDRAHEFVGMQAALHQQLALAFADQLRRPAPRRRGCGARRRSRGRQDRGRAPPPPPGSCAAGPTRTGTISPASAASSAPRSEVSSQGCATTVTAGASLRAAAIRRSYFDG